MKRFILATVASIVLAFPAMAAEAPYRPFSMAEVLIGFGLFYMSPSIIGLCRGIAGLGWLFIFNLLYGWTVLGWIACWFKAYGPTREQDRINKAMTAITYDNAREFIASRQRRPAH